MHGFKSTAALALAVAFAATPALADMAAMPAAALPSTRVVFSLKDRQGDLSCRSLPEAFRSLSTDYSREHAVNPRVLDFPTYGSRSERMIPAGRAYFLVDVDRAVGAEGGVKILAFSDRAAARKYQQRLGGELRDFEDAWQAAADYWSGSLSARSPRVVASKPGSDPPARPAARAESHCPS